MTTKVLVDCDTGVDDTMALLYLLASPSAEVVAITSVFGNTSAPQAAQNSLKVLAMTGNTHIPVAQGACRTVRGDDPPLAAHVHGADGMGNTGLPASGLPLSPLSSAELIVATVRANPGEIHLVATGPLTNLALALGLEPRLPQLVSHVTIMGGAALAPGNVTPVAEANIEHDAEAAQAVLTAGWPVTLVPLDVTMREIVTEGHRARLAAGPPPAQLVAKAADVYFDFFAETAYAQRQSPCHDALAAAIAVGDVIPRVAPVVNVQVDTGDGPGRGQTICDLREYWRDFDRGPDHGVRVVLETDGTFADLLVERILSLPGAASAEA